MNFLDDLYFIFSKFRENMISRGLLIHRQVAAILLVLCFLIMITFLSGCGFKYVEVSHPEAMNSKRLLDPNHSPFEISKSDTDPNRTMIHLHPAKITLEKPCRVNYRKMEYWFGKIVAINGKLPDGKEYPIYIDSGYYGGGTEISVNDLIAKESNLQVLTKKLSPNERSQWGLCFLPELKMGKVVLQRPSCAFIPWHREFQILGIPLWQEKNLFLGNSLMSRFKYLCFHNTDMQLEFSYNQSFQPEVSKNWTHYPFTLRKQDGRIMVNIPIAGETCSIYFDTGGSGTFLKSDMWEKMRNQIIAKKPKDSKFFSYQLGFLPCRKTNAKTLRVGNIELKNTEIVILPEGSPYLPKDIPGYISIWTFKDTSVALDFENNLMWVKNNGYSLNNRH